MRRDRPLSPVTSFGTILLASGGIVFAVFRFFSGTFSVGAQVAPPTVIVTANPSTITLGAASTITWSSTNAQSCTSSGDFGTGPIPTNGSIVVQPPAAGTYAYDVTCIGPGGSASFTFNVPLKPVCPVSGCATNKPILGPQLPISAATSTCASEAPAVSQIVNSVQSATAVTAPATALGCIVTTGVTDSGVQYAIVKDPSTNATVGVFIGPQE